MKRLVIYALVLLLFACAEQKELSPVETAQIVAESFYTKDNTTLKNHTTKEGYDGMVSIQNFVPDGNSNDSDFKILNEKTDGEIAW
ncbi:hypothetical protein GCM10011531_09930 [Aquaticitalea lipolytica]|uniref:Uncharacterized protein n=1 Tax=Aquaticitalea lipolytica TaxID=1247562 RepID=A0A8J2TME2_9FLAO|nr:MULTISPECIES: hypothetical protein [Flavobacteriaceae]GFZ81699.1 hypothetical protein GCM10011531_09930 [Aquaticitalea lipolytica]